MEKPVPEPREIHSGEDSRILDFLRSEKGWRLLKAFNVENDDRPIEEFALSLENLDDFSTYWLTKIYRYGKAGLREKSASVLRQRSDAARFLADF